MNPRSRDSTTAGVRGSGGAARSFRRLHPPAGLRRGGARGFTLPEVLATMVLIGIVVPVVMQGASIALAAAGHARHLAQAAQLGEAKLSEMVVLQGFGQTAGSGDFGAEWSQYRWQCQTQYLDFNAHELRLVVTWMERGEERSVELSTIVYDTSSTTTEEESTGSSTGTTS